MPGSSQQQTKYITNPSIIYSEPQLNNPYTFLDNQSAAYSNMADTIDALSESALNQVKHVLMNNYDFWLDFRMIIIVKTVKFLKDL